MKGLRCATVATVAFVLACALAGGASAAAPSNDTFAGATAFALVPFSQTLDTTEATTDAIDAEANTDCGAPATEASVWYAFTAPSSQVYLVDVSQSNYPAGVTVVTGAPGAFTFKNCGPRRTFFGAAAGQTYYILVFDFIPGGTNGGTQLISVNLAPPPPEVHLTIDPFGHFVARTGVVTVTGTFTCSGAVEGQVFVAAGLTQNVGRLIISGFRYRVFPAICDGTPQPWTLTIRGQNGRFGGGRATISAEVFVCGPLQCAEDFAEQTIRLRH